MLGKVRFLKRRIENVIERCVATTKARCEFYTLSGKCSEEFMESHLPAFREKNPHLEVITELNRGYHPLLKGLYINKNERVVCIKNMTPDEILQCATRLRNSQGRKVVKLRTRHVTNNPSVQGTWTTSTVI